MRGNVCVGKYTTRLKIFKQKHDLCKSYTEGRYLLSCSPQRLRCNMAVLSADWRNEEKRKEHYLIV